MVAVVLLLWVLFCCLSATPTAAFVQHHAVRLEKRHRVGCVCAAQNDSVDQSFTETATRSAAKAFCWRLLSSSVTFCTTVRFSQSYRNAFQLIGISFVPKATVYFLGDRIMNRVRAGRTSGSDSVKRSLTKAVSWRTLGAVSNLCLANFVTKDIRTAGKIVSSDLLLKLIVLFAYERLWAGIEWGKTPDGG